MVRTIQANWMGAPMAAYLKARPTKKRIHKYKIWQHNTQSLVAAIWSDNGIVKTLSNYHHSIIVADGLMRKKMGDNNVQEKHQLPASWCTQTKYWLFRHVPPSRWKRKDDRIKMRTRETRKQETWLFILKKSYGNKQINKIIRFTIVFTSDLFNNKYNTQYQYKRYGIHLNGMVYPSLNIVFCKGI